jgi:hypothetical protein
MYTTTTLLANPKTANRNHYSHNQEESINPMGDCAPAEQGKEKPRMKHSINTHPVKNKVTSKPAAGKKLKKNRCF